jgi:hypothetical protein
MLISPMIVYYRDALVQHLHKNARAAAAKHLASNTESKDSILSLTEDQGSHYKINTKAGFTRRKWLAMVGTGSLASIIGVKVVFDFPAWPGKTPERFAEITSPNPEKLVPAEIKVEGAVRGLEPSDELYIESQTEEYQFFYRRVSCANGRFWYDAFHPGKPDADFGKTFRLSMFVPEKGTRVERKDYKTALPGERISSPVIYRREMLLAQNK